MVGPTEIAINSPNAKPARIAEITRQDTNYIPESERSGLQKNISSKANPPNGVGVFLAF